MKRNWPLLAAWALFLVSLVCPTATRGSQPHDVLGYAVLLGGWGVLFAGSPWAILAFVSWLTNFVFLATWWRSRAMLLIVPACFLINVITAATAPRGGFAGLYDSPGFYVWLAAFAAASVAIFVAGGQKEVSTNM